MQYAFISKFDNTIHNVIAVYTNSVICACVQAHVQCLAHTLSIEKYLSSVSDDI